MVWVIPAFNHTLKVAFRASLEYRERPLHTAPTEWQWPLSGVHYMMVKSAQPGVGGCNALPFHFIYHHEQSCGVRSSWEGIYTPGGFIKGILRGVRCTKSLRVLFLHRRPPSWTTLVQYSRAVFIFNEPAFRLFLLYPYMYSVLHYCTTYLHIYVFPAPSFRAKATMRLSNRPTHILYIIGV